MKTSVPDFHDCADELRSVDLRATPARLGVLAVLEQATIPVSASDILAYLKSKKILADEATVFRILRVYTDKGLIKTIQFHEDKMRYEHAAKPSHHHFVCTGCGAISDVTGCTVNDLEKHIEKTKGAKVFRHSLEFFGTCRRCSS